MSFDINDNTQRKRMLDALVKWLRNRQIEPPDAIMLTAEMTASLAMLLRDFDRVDAYEVLRRIHEYEINIMDRIYADRCKRGVQS